MKKANFAVFLSNIKKSCLAKYYIVVENIYVVIVLNFLIIHKHNKDMPMTVL